MTGLGRALVEGYGASAVTLLARSWRVDVLHRHRWASVAHTGRAFVLLCWHDALLPVMWLHRHRQIQAVISEARDGEYLTRFATSLGYGVIRGSSTRGGRRALLGAVRALERGNIVGITPDGPRGPRRTLKAGALVAAARAGALVLPVHADARPAWHARSWDAFLVPAPFARVRVAYGEPFEVEPGPPSPAATALATEALDEAARMASWPDGAATLTA